MIISACQQCERTLTSGVRRHEKARRARIKVADMTELVLQAMEQAANGGSED
jgi:hypothetical protein